MIRAPVLRAFPTHSAAFTAWMSHELLGLVRPDRGTECFTALENASADRCETRAAFCCPSPAPPHVWGVRARAWAFSSHGACSDQASDTSVATPSYPALVGPSLYLPALVSDSVTEPSRSRLCPREEAAKVALTTSSWKPMARDVLRCLPPTRTLRRIRWPLQPRSRDRLTALSGDATTAERRSHVALGLGRSSSLNQGGGRLTSHRFAVLASDTLVPDCRAA